MNPDAEPNSVFLLKYILFAMVAGSALVTIFKWLKQPGKALEYCGVAVRRIGRTLREIERKTFHVCGLLVPLIHQLLLSIGWSQQACTNLCWSITITGIAADAARIYIPVVRNNWPARHILRKEEINQLCGACYFSLGCTVCIAVSPPSIAMASILFLVVGDMAAALIGVSFGGEKCTFRLGREGKKSMEGSVAMFVVCLFLGFTVFVKSHLREYPVVIGAFVATITELYEPFGLNDNLTIPLFSSIALQFGFARIQSCIAGAPLEPLSTHIDSDLRYPW